MSDLIDRQAAIEIASDKRCGMNFFDPSEKAIYEVLSDVIHDLYGLPSAQLEPIKINIDHELTKDEYEKLLKDMADAPIVLLPSAQPRKGKWAGKGDSEGFGIFICDNCGKFSMMEYDFCPNCGSYNGGKNEA